MAPTQFASLSAVTISTTEISIPTGTTYSSGSPQTTAGVFQLFIDAANMAKGDEFRIRGYEKVLSGGTQRVFAAWTLLGVQAELLVLPSFMLLQGWDMTLLKIAGTDRAFTASIRKA